MKKVLIVEDSKLIADALRMILEPENLQVLYTDKGAQVVEMCISNSIDLIILDLMMPGVDGVEVFDRLKKNEKTLDIPVIILTARKQALTSHNQLRSCDKFIVKPFVNEDIVREVKKILRSP